MNSLIFPFLFLLLMVVLLWIIFGCKGYTSAKIWLINIVVIFVLILWIGIKSYTGWPSESPVPSQARLVNVISNEPSSIYVLVERFMDQELYVESWYDILYYKPIDSVRVFKIPYDKDTHRKLENAMEEVKKGRYVLIGKDKIIKYEELEQEVKVDGVVKTDAIQVYILPPNKLIRKPLN